MQNSGKKQAHRNFFRAAHAGQLPCSVEVFVTARMVSPGAEELVVALAGRRRGLTIAEAAFRLDCGYHAMRRTFLRLAREGRLWPTPLRRRREWMFERATKGSVVWKAKYTRPDPLDAHRRWTYEGALADWQRFERVGAARRRHLALVLAR